jgi:predicted kinase
LKEADLDMEGIIFIGIQGSGKTTFYQRYFSKTHIRISLDMLRTRHRESILVAACIEAKQPFVIDNTNPTRQERQKYIEKLKKNKFKVKGYCFQSDISECLERNIQRTGKEKIPEVGVKGTYKKLELPSYDEGFEELYSVTLKETKFIVKEWEKAPA